MLSRIAGVYCNGYGPNSNVLLIWTGCAGVTLLKMIEGSLSPGRDKDELILLHN